MTNELEKKFFDTFGIEPKYAYLVTDMFYTSDSHNYEATKNDLIKYFSDKNCGRYKVIEVYKNYPQITDRMLLELICIKNKELISIVQVRGNNLEELKSYILQTWAHWYTYYSSLPVHKERADKFKQQVRTLFKEK